MIGYRMDVRTPGEIAADDPFCGRGAFLPMAGAKGSEIIGALERAFGEVPAVAWPDRGAWVDLADRGMSEADALLAWGQVT
ncbi:MAG: hypothetical protein JWM19_933 [Actinomycetia bacterium]|nr:hypothetical protein [Actinomycetes bacterium]